MEALTHRCEAIIRGEQCANEAIVALTVACRHEHMPELYNCAHHAIKLRSFITEGSVLCRACWGSTQPHDCHISYVSTRLLTDA